MPTHGAGQNAEPFTSVGGLHDLLARSAPWLLKAEPVSVLARITLAGAVLYVAWRAWDVVSWGLECLAWTGTPGYAVAAFFVWQAWKNRRGFHPGTVHGSAKWAETKALAADRMLDHRDGILLGRFKDTDRRRLEALKRLFTRPVAESDGVVRHFITSFTRGVLDLYRGEDEPLICAPTGKYVSMLTVAPTGAGKGVGVVVPNLLNYKHSVIVVDIKGENFAITAKSRKEMGQRVLTLDPFHISDTESATLNPLDLIANDSPTLIEDLRSLAEAIVVKSPDEKEPHWNEHAANLIFAVLLLVALEFKDKERNLNELRKTLSNSEELKLALEFMQKSDALGGMLARSGGMFASMNEKEFSSVQSTANRHTAFLDSPLIAPSVATTSFNIRSIAKRKTSLYLILPAQYVQSHARLMRLWINALLFTMKQAPVSETHEILFMLDEVAALGELQPLREALTLLRGWGVRLWFIVQSINQLEEAYPGPRFKTMLANFGIKQFFGIADLDTAKYVAESIGKQTQIAPSVQGGWNSGISSGKESSSSSRGRSGGWSQGTIERDLIRPEEVMRESGADSVFIFQQGRFPILARRLTYYTDREFNPEAVHDPPHAVSLASRVLAALGVLIALYWAEATIDFGAMMRHRPLPREAAPYLEEPPMDWAAIAPKSGRSKTVRRTPSVRSKTEPVKPPLTEFELLCPNCKNQDTVPVSLSGKTVRCRNCQSEIIVPEME